MYSKKSLCKNVLVIRFLEGCKTRRRFSATMVTLIDKVTLKEGGKKHERLKFMERTIVCLMLKN